jgi:hypothetical protein
MKENFTRKGLSAPDERLARERCLGKGVEAPNMTTLKDFFRFQASTMRSKIKKTLNEASLNPLKKPTDAALNAFAECFFARFTCVTGAEVDETERSEVYKVGLATNSFGRYTV